MALHYTEFLQVKEKGNHMFERDLYKLSDILGRPAPEFRGAQVDEQKPGNLSWLIETSVRGNIKSAQSRTMAFTTMDSSWDDGLCRAMQWLLARLCEEHKAELKNTPFEFYGRRDVEGRPTSTTRHHTFGEHILDMEILLFRTQADLRSLRYRTDFERTALEASRQHVAHLQHDQADLHQRVTRQKKNIAKLRKRVAEQDEMIEDLERRADEMEEEGEDLRKETSAFISDDEDYLEEMDYEEEDDEEELVDEEEEPAEPLLEEDEEDPEELVFEPDTDVVEPSVPAQ